MTPPGKYTGHSSWTVADRKHNLPPWSSAGAVHPRIERNPEYKEGREGREGNVDRLKHWVAVHGEIRDGDTGGRDG